VVEAHGGRIWIAEGRAVGAEVCIRLPRAPVADAVAAVSV
jgi:signal transduction histidine kinase